MEINLVWHVNMSAERTFQLMTWLCCFDASWAKTLWRYSKVSLKKKYQIYVQFFPADIDEKELKSEVGPFKYLIQETAKNLKSDSIYLIFTEFINMNLEVIYPNIYTLFRLFLILPPTSLSSERSFSNLKLIKTYLRSTMLQERLSNLAILSIEKELVKNIKFDDIIDQFAEIKSRKIKL